MALSKPKISVQDQQFLSAYSVPPTFPSAYPGVDGYFGMGRIVLPDGENSFLMRILEGKSSKGTVSTGYFYVESTSTGDDLVITTEIDVKGRYGANGVNWVETVDVTSPYWYVLPNSVTIGGAESKYDEVGIKFI